MCESLSHLGTSPEAEVCASATGFLSILCPNIMETNKNQRCTWNCFENVIISQHPYWETRRTFCLCLFDYWLNKECLHPTCIKMQARERLGLQCCPCVFVYGYVCMYVFVCRWRVNFRKCFWGQDIRRSNN